MVKKGSRRAACFALLVGWAVGVPALLHAFDGKEVQTAPVVHFALVATGALVAAFASIGLTVAGVRADDGRTVLLGAAFSTMTALPTLRHLAIGGLLHDMGKLRTPESILCKPAALTPDEFAAIKRHPQDGARLLADLAGFEPEVLALVLDLHERLDGGGYPRGLRGDAIAIATRVLTVCDVYDALVSHRVYRPAWSQERALGLLHEESGAAFDPRCVAGLERVLGPVPGQLGWVATFADAPAAVRAAALRR